MLPESSDIFFAMRAILCGAHKRSNERRINQESTKLWTTLFIQTNENRHIKTARIDSAKVDSEIAQHQRLG